MVHLAERPGDRKRNRNVLLHQRKPLVGTQVLDVFRAPGQKIVERDDLMAAGQQPVAKMGGDEARAPRNQATQ
jgi:hypothetical protein